MTAKLTVVIPTYRREEVLLDTIGGLLKLQSPPAEILVVDQTPVHEQSTDRPLSTLENQRRIRLIRLTEPSVTHAMNIGLRLASSDVVLFVDDDIVPGPRLVDAHARAQTKHNIVAGQVLQPGELPSNESTSEREFRFSSSRGG